MSEVIWSLEDVRDHLGDIPLTRIRTSPPPGTATIDDAIQLDADRGPLCELIDGVLVEKTVGWYESLIAMEIAHRIKAFVEERNLGKVLGADGTLQILPHQMRMPDVSFISWERFPDGALPKEPMPELVPDLAVEVLSSGNTPAEMDRKLRDYFEAGVQLVWYVDPQSRTARIFTSADDATSVDESSSLDGGKILPGLLIPLDDVFAQADQTGGK